MQKTRARHDRTYLVQLATAAAHITKISKAFFKYGQ